MLWLSPYVMKKKEFNKFVCDLSTEGKAQIERLCEGLLQDERSKAHYCNFYLCDNGYTNGQGFLTPYKGVRYHLDEWGEGTSIPQNPKEFFNMTHSKARNVIERAFGLLKKRWTILRDQSFYDIRVQNRMIMACVLLHNFIRLELQVDPMEEELSDDDEDDHEDNENTEFIDTVEPSQIWTNWRDNLATINVQ
ncbi:hypothetical protein DH2020_002905 [Rehmannia glutinosa]|uniref:DDE Tnp4 domain-containing protein n=1 Tax=Rehmannia glutinosa TaxID=99300 RepID=A0ABR0XVP9_REHGL